MAEHMEYPDPFSAVDAEKPLYYEDNNPSSNLKRQRPNAVEWMECAYNGCTKMIQTGRSMPRRCTEHHALAYKRKRCSHNGCNNPARGKGLCKRHGAPFLLCSYPGCTLKSHSGRRCMRHAINNPRKRCSEPDCENFAVMKDLCRRHGAPGMRCAYPECTKFARGPSGMCRKHDNELSGGSSPHPLTPS